MRFTKAKEKTEIARVNAKAWERAREEAKTKVWEKNNAVRRTAEEAAAKVRFKAKAERAKKERT